MQYICIIKAAVFRGTRFSRLAQLPLLDLILGAAAVSMEAATVRRCVAGCIDGGTIQS